jgi:5-(carboxyamino)imidazole ribonucleotide synthase
MINLHALMKNFNTLKIGMLGGGQLGRMLLQKAADFSLNIKVLDPDPAAPCRNLTEEFTLGSFNDFDTVYAFGKTTDFLTIEIEHVNVEALMKLKSEGVLVYPQPEVIALVQDKGEQKQFFKKNNIPTSPFRMISDRSELSSAKFPFPFIQKLRKGGYDGKGVMKISSKEDLAIGFDDPSIAEEMIDFSKEISVIVARNEKGECVCYPPVEMEFNPEANLVEFLFSPADINSETGQKAKSIAIDVAEALKITGVLAVEMFLTNSGDILVNEIAPRPHNSGHHTIEANITSQYEQHLRAILGLPLGNTDIIHSAIMVNLLGEKNFDGIAHYENFNEVLGMDGVYIHLYGKKYTRPFRKMGHVTIVGLNIKELKQKAIEVKKLLKVTSR